MKAMKAAAMKTAGARKRIVKAKKVSVIAKGYGAKARVLKGDKAKTVGGLEKDELMKGHKGKVVSKKASAHARSLWMTNGAKAWSDAVKAARLALGLTGFVAVGGKSTQGKALYAKAKSLRVWAPARGGRAGVYRGR